MKSFSLVGQWCWLEKLFNLRSLQRIKSWMLHVTVWMLHVILGPNQSSISKYNNSRNWPSIAEYSSVTSFEKKRFVNIYSLKFTYDKSFHWYSFEDHKFNICSVYVECKIIKCFADVIDYSIRSKHFYWSYNCKHK